MTKPESCGFPGCIALASNGAFCAPHRRLIVGAERREPRRDPDEARAALRQLVLELIPEAETTFSGIEVLPLPVPALLDFHFHSPDAILLLDDQLSQALALRAVGHQMAHVEQQRQRFRCRRYAGRLKRSGLPGSDARIAPWDDVEASRSAYEVALPESTRDLLAAHTPRCRYCHRHPLDLTWLY